MALAVSNALVERSHEPSATGGAILGKRFGESLAQASTQSTQVQRTRMTPSAASAELRRAWTKVTGEAPDDKTVALLTAQWAHETAHGASMYNYNFGGIKGTGPTGLSVEQHTKEGWGRNERQITDRFRAYENPEAGAEDYVKLLTHRFPEATSAARAGNAQGFVQGLKQRGYFTGDAQAYQRSVNSLSEQYLKGEYKDGADQTRSSGSTQVSSLTNNSRHLIASSGPVVPAPAHELEIRLPMIQPLAPTALLGSLSSAATNANDLRATSDGYPWSGVSPMSMVDEVLRATLQMSSPDSDSNRGSGNVG
jgi:hypothetical protein